MKTWLLVCNRQRILPREPVIEVVSWIANTHTCHLIVIPRQVEPGSTFPYEKPRKMFNLENANELGVSFICDPDFEPFPQCGSQVHWGPSVYAGIRAARDGNLVEMEEWKGGF